MHEQLHQRLLRLEGLQTAPVRQSVDEPTIRDMTERINATQRDVHALVEQQQSVREHLMRTDEALTQIRTDLDAKDFQEPDGDEAKVAQMRKELKRREGTKGARCCEDSADAN